MPNDDIKSMYYDPRHTWEYMDAQHQLDPTKYPDPRNGRSHTDRCHPWRSIRWMAFKEILSEEDRLRFVNSRFAHLRTARWYSKENTRIESTYRRHPDKPWVDRRLVYRWMGSDPSLDRVVNSATGLLNHDVLLEDMNGVEGLVVPYGQQEEEAGVQQPDSCYQYALNSDWLNADTPWRTPGTQPVYKHYGMREDTLTAAELKEKRNIQAELRTGNRKPQVNAELTMFHQPDKSERTDQSPAYYDFPTCETSDLQTDKSLRKLVFRLGDRGQRFFKRTLFSAQGNTIVTEPQNLKYLKPCYVYDDSFVGSGKLTGSMDSQLAQDRDARLVLLDINAHAPLLFGELKPLYMQPANQLVQFKELKGGLTNKFDGEVPVGYPEDKAVHAALKRIQSGLGEDPSVDHVAGELATIQAGLKVDARGFKSQFPVLRDAMKTAQNSSQAVREQVVRDYGLKKAQTLCDIANSIDSPLFDKDSLRTIQYEDGDDVVYPMACDKEATVIQQTLPTDGEIKVVFFSTLPSMNSDAPVLAAPGLDCARVQAYNLDYLNRPYKKLDAGDYQKRTPPIWQMANLYNPNAQSGGGANPAHPNMVEKLYSQEVQDGHAQYRQQMEAYNEDLQAFQGRVDLDADQQGTWQKHVALYEAYEDWLETLPDAVDQSAFEDRPVKCLRVTYDETYTAETTIYPINPYTGLVFSRVDYMAIGIGEGEMLEGSSARSFKKRPTIGPIEAEELRSLGVTDLEEFEGLGIYVERGLTVAEANSLLQLYPELGCVYPLPLPDDPPTQPGRSDQRPEKPPAFAIKKLEGEREIQFNAGPSKNTKGVKWNIKSDVLDDTAFCYGLRRLGPGGLTTRMNAPTPGLPTELYKTTGLDARYILFYAMYDKAEYDRLGNQELARQGAANNQAAADAAGAAQQQAEQAAAQAAARSVRDAAAAAQTQAENEEQDRFETTAQPIRENARSWIQDKTPERFFQQHYGVGRRVQFTDSDRMPNEAHPVDMDPEIWCNQYISCKTDLNPFDVMYRAKLARGKLINREVHGRYKMEREWRDILTMEGMNNRSGIRYEDDAAFTKRVAQYNEESYEFKRLPWPPVRHEASFEMVCFLTQIFEVTEYEACVTRLKETVYKLPKHKSLSTRVVDVAARASGAAARVDQRHRPFTKLAGAREEEDSKSALTRTENWAGWLRRSQSDRAKNCDGRLSRPDNSDSDDAGDAGDAGVDHATLFGPSDEEMEEEEGEEAGPSNAPGLFGPDSQPDAPNSSDEEMEEEEDPSDLFATRRGKRPMPNNDDQDARRRAKVARMKEVLRANTGGRLERLHATLVGDVANRRTLEDTLDEITALVGQASNQSFAQMVLRCDTEDRWILHKFRED